MPARWPAQLGLRKIGQALLFRGEEDRLSRQHRTALLSTFSHKCDHSYFYLFKNEQFQCLWCHHVFVGHRADGAEGNHWGSKDQEWRSTGCHTWSFEHPRKHERLDNHRMAFLYLSFASFNFGRSRLLDLQIQRQNSCESISSLNSLTSMSSMGSMKDQDAKKKKKKSWVRT